MASPGASAAVAGQILRARPRGGSPLPAAVVSRSLAAPVMTLLVVAVVREERPASWD